MYAGRYFKRWARRLRECGFNREDAKVLGLATYGTDAAGRILGVETIVTFDRSLINNYEAQRPALETLAGYDGAIIATFPRCRFA